MIRWDEVRWDETQSDLLTLDHNPRARSLEGRPARLSVLLVAAMVAVVVVLVSP